MTSLHKLLSGTTSFLREKRGAALIEFAFILPVLLLVLMGAVEITRYLMINQRVITAASNMNSYISQLQLPENDPAPIKSNLTPAFNSLLEPFDPQKGGFRVTGFQRASVGAPVTKVWTQTFGSFVGATDVPARLGTLPSTLLPLPANTTTKDLLITVEVYYNYDNVIPGAKAFSSALNYDRNIYQMTAYLSRVNPQPMGSDLADLPDPSGCCGAYCKTQPKNINCRGCYTAPDGVTILKGLCTTKPTLGIPDCVPCPPKPSPTPCTPATHTCRCDKAYCKFNGG